MKEAWRDPEMSVISFDGADTDTILCSLTILGENETPMDFG